MGKSRDKIITVRVDEDMYEKIKKYASNSNLALSEYVYKIIESSFDESDRTDLLIKNIHEEILQMEDMITLMQGFNFEVFATLLARTSKSMDPSQKKELQEKRIKAIDGLNNYMTKVSEHLIAGESICNQGNNQQ